MGLAAWSHTVRQSFTRILGGSLGRQSERFGFENRFQMISLTSPASVKLPWPVVDNRKEFDISHYLSESVYPRILDYHGGNLTPPINGRRTVFRGGPENSSVFLEYRIRKAKNNTIILKITGMDPQVVEISFDGRGDISLPILVFLPRA